MINRTTRLRWRRRVRRSKRQVGEIGNQAEVNLEKHFFKRLTKLPGVFRFTVTWLLLLLLLMGGLVVQNRALNNYYLENKPAPGGTYVEGIYGAFTNANPIYAIGSVDKSVSRLIFSGLLKFDSKNQLVPDLAKDWQADANGLNYTVRLKNDITWQDGQQLTADDVVFTFQTIQNPDARSPLLPGWQGISIKALDKLTVKFTLPNPVSTFASTLTTGIVPKHLLQNVPAEQLRSISFNTNNPIGAGPFMWEAIQIVGQTPETRQEQIALVPFNKYINGKAKLNKFIIRSYHDTKTMVEGFKNQDLNGMAGLDSMPEELKGKTNINQYDVPVLGQVMVFFKTSNPILSNLKVRRALNLATDKTDIINGLGYSVIAADQPLLKFKLGYDKKYAQAKYNFDQAAKLLDEDGWKKDSSGILTKKGQQLSFNLYTQDAADYKNVSSRLNAQWRKLGVNLKLNILTDNQLQQALSNHSYDALLYGIEIGNDPDVFAYWDSAQADVRAQNRTNFSEYKSEIADNALEAGRTRLEPKLRIIKYRPFLQAWQQDTPAIALYQPRYLYVTRGMVFGFNPTSFSSSVSRYANVSNWMISEDMQPIE